MMWRRRASGSRPLRSGRRRRWSPGPGEQGLSLTGPDGLLKQLTKTVLETALNQELTEHVGHDKHAPAGKETGNVRNGTRPKTVLTEGSGQVGIEVPRDRDGTFEPQIVKKRQRRLTGVDEIVLSLYAKVISSLN
jgi:putative transposase